MFNSCFIVSICATIFLSIFEVIISVSSNTINNISNNTISYNDTTNMLSMYTWIDIHGCIGLVECAIIILYFILYIPLINSTFQIMSYPFCSAYLFFITVLDVAWLTYGSVLFHFHRSELSIFYVVIMWLILFGGLIFLFTRLYLFYLKFKKYNHYEIIY